LLHTVMHNICLSERQLALTNAFGADQILWCSCSNTVKDPVQSAVQHFGQIQNRKIIVKNDQISSQPETRYMVHSKYVKFEFITNCKVKTPITNTTQTDVKELTLHLIS